MPSESAVADMESDVVVRLVSVEKSFQPNVGLIGAVVRKAVTPIRAVDGVTLAIRRGEIVSLVGESGSGKSTLGEVLTMLQPPSRGQVLLRDLDLTRLSGRKLRPHRRHLQVVFQDPYQTLDPRMTILRTVREPIIVNEQLTREESFTRVAEMLEEVGLRPAEAFLHMYPRELSGGQRQRVAIARALILNPDVVVADEPVSMLDVSVASGILNLMLRLREKFGTAFLFITHDLAVVRYMGDRIAIMYKGKIVEMGAAADVIQQPKHPYTQLLLDSIPSSDSLEERPPAATPDVSGDTPIETGCSFRPRCPVAREKCRGSPPLYEPAPDHHVRCFVWEPEGEASVRPDSSEDTHTSSS